MKRRGTRKAEKIPQAFTLVAAWAKPKGLLLVVLTEQERKALAKLMKAAKTVS